MKNHYFVYLFLSVFAALCFDADAMRRRTVKNAEATEISPRVITVVPYKKIAVVPLPAELFDKKNPKIPALYTRLMFNGEHELSFVMRRPYGVCGIVLNVETGILRAFSFKNGNADQRLSGVDNNDKGKEKIATSPNGMYRAHLNCETGDITIYGHRDHIKLPASNCCFRSLGCLIGCFRCMRDNCCKDKNQ